jgi:hypothetical protein
MVNKINKEERFLFNLSKNMKQENVHISTEVNPRLSSIAIVGNHTIGEYNLLLYSLTTFDAGVYRCDMIHKGSERFQGFRLMLQLR